MSLIVYLNNDNVLSIKARDAIDDADLSGATVTYDFKTSAASVDTGSLVYDTTETINGKIHYVFRATLADTLSLDAAVDYYVDIAFNGGAGLQGNWEDVPVDAQKRSS